jgi:hypothetical protein
MLFTPSAVFLWEAPMDQRDKTFAVLGVVAVIISAGPGIAFATGAIGQDDGGGIDYIAIWSIGGTQTDNQQGLNTDIVEFDVNEHNLTEVTVQLTWTDDELISPFGQRDDVLTMTVEGPPGLAMDPQTAAGSTGDVTISFPLATVPIAEDPDLFEEYDYLDATGTWSVTVSVQALGFRDTGNDWTVLFRYSYYEGRLVEAPEAS